jgi:hypothetical protein
MKTSHWILASLTIALSGCVSSRPQKTSLELQAIQAREFEAPKKVAFAAMLSVFQDMGYVVSSAEFETGFITAKSPTHTSPGFFVVVMKDTKATAFIEELKPGVSKVRLSFVRSQETSGTYGTKTAEDAPIEDAGIYENAFKRIQEGIFIRLGTQ